MFDTFSQVLPWHGIRVCFVYVQREREQWKETQRFYFENKTIQGIRNIKAGNLLGWRPQDSLNLVAGVDREPTHKDSKIINGL